MQQEYDKLVADAEAAGVTERIVQGWLAEKGMLVDRVGDLVIFTDESVEAVEYAAGKIEPEVTPELAEYRRLKALAERSGITQEEFQKRWKKLGDKKNPDRITKKRLENMTTELEVMIKDSLDRQFAKEVYGLEFPPAQKDTDWVPSAVSWKRLSIGWFPGVKIDPIAAGILTIDEVNHEPFGYVRSGDDDNDVDIVETSEEESGSSTIHDTEGSEAEDQAGAPTMLYQELCNRWADKFDKEKIDWLLDDYCNGTEHNSTELTNELLTEFESYLCSVQSLTDDSEIKRTEVGIIDRTNGRALTLFDEDMPETPETGLITFEEGGRLVESIVEKQGGTEKFLKHITERIRDKTRLLKDRTNKYYPLLRSLVEPEMARYETNTYKKDGSGEISHRAGELKRQTYKGFSGGDVIFRKTGGLKLPKQFVLDNWAAQQCKDILETLQDAADDWLANHAPPEVKAVTKIQITTKVSKKNVGLFADEYHFPGVERLPIHDTGKMFIGVGGPWNIKKEIGELAAALNELAAACGDKDEDEGEEE